MTPEGLFPDPTPPSATSAANGRAGMGCVGDTLAEQAVASFGRHESFAPRHGWMAKVYEGVKQFGPELFQRPSLPVDLGVGLNMARSMRFWARALKLTSESRGGGRAHVLELTPLAGWLLDPDVGADPWLEDPASLWLLHWQLLAPPCQAPTWWVAFHGLPSTHFREDQLVDLVMQQVAAAGWKAPARTSVARDVQCLTRMYGGGSGPEASGSDTGSFEDLIACPFRDLGLVGAGGRVSSPPRGRAGARTWHFARVVSPAPPFVVAYTCVDYLRTRGEQSISLERLAHDSGSPGRAMRQTLPDLRESLTEAAAGEDGLRLRTGSTSARLVLEGAADELATRLLERQFDRGRT